MPENPLRRQSTQAPGLQQSLSQKRAKKSTSPKNNTTNKFKSSSRSKSFKKNAMFSSVATANIPQNQITDQANFEFSTHRKTREEIDKAYKSLTKDEDSDGGRTNSVSRGSSISNGGETYNGMKESNHLFEN